MEKSTEELAKKILLKVAKNVLPDDLGKIRSLFKGNGRDFKDLRSYEYGDDLRFIDWKVVAKTRQLMVKDFITENNREILICIDLFPSMFSGENYLSKLQVAIEILTLLALATEKSKEKFSVALFEKNMIVFPKLSGQLSIMTVLNIIKSKNYINEKGEINPFTPNSFDTWDRHWISEFSKIASTKRNIIFISDFFDANIVNINEKKFSFLPVRIISQMDQSIYFPVSLNISNTLKMNSKNRFQIHFPLSTEEIEKNFKGPKVFLKGNYLHKFVMDLNGQCI